MASGTTPSARITVDVLYFLAVSKGFADQARLQIPQAEFVKAHESVDSIVHLQADNESISALKADLDKIQNAYLASMKNAQKARTDHKLDKAADAAKNALALCPESPQARLLLKEITVDQDKALPLLNEAKSLIRAAKFTDADALLEQVEKLWSTVKGLDATKKLSARNRVEYHEHLQRSQQAITHRALDEALKEAHLACDVCPQSSEARTLLKAVQDNQSRVHTLLEEAVSSTKTARFDEANAKLLLVEDLWTNVSELAEAREDLIKSRERFSKAMLTAKEAQVQKDLERALHATGLAMYVCPKSKEARALAESIENTQSAARDHFKEGENAYVARKFDEALSELRQAEKIWPMAPGLREAIAQLLQVKKGRRLYLIKWSIAVGFILVALYLLSKFLLILANHQHANAAVQHAKNQDYVAAIREYHKCYAIPLLASPPKLPEHVAKDMETADLKRKEQFTSSVSQAENLLSKSQIDQARLNAKEASELACIIKEKKQVNAVLTAIAEHQAKVEYDALVARARNEILLANKIELLKKAMRKRNVSATYQMLQAAVAEQQRRPKVGDIITNSIDMKMAYIPQGEFIMGSSEEKKESPPHKVTISKGFYMGVCEVTQAQYKTIMGSNPSGHKKWLRGGRLPVEGVSWDDATKFCSELRRRERRTYRLPTEAEWEFACRAGRSSTRFSFGNGSALSEYAWYQRNSGEETQAVGKKKPNAFGLYDMHGNVYEWCSDWYDDHYLTADDQIDPQGPKTGTSRTLRGGSYDCSPTECRSAARISHPPNENASAFGFRVVLEPK
jgi:formylglycine-generating enzyme required for sulfatase activity